MKRRISSVLIGIWTTGALFFSVFPATAQEEEAPSRPIRPVQSERDLGSDQSSMRLRTDETGDRVQLDSALKFETGSRPKATPPEREAEALRFHQNTVVERFENADGHGQVFLTFSADRIDLKLRSITGAEAPVAGVRPSD